MRILQRTRLGGSLTAVLLAFLAILGLPGSAVLGQETPPSQAELPQEEPTEDEPAQEIAEKPPAGPITGPIDGIVPEPLFERADQVSANSIAYSGAANSSNAKWLVDLYSDVLLRDADESGLDHWLALVAAGGNRSRRAVAGSFLNSIEGSRGEAIRAYADILDRAPDAGGLVYWTEFLRTGSVLVLRFQHLASDEFYLKAGGTDAKFVAAVYQRLLFRGPDAGGLQYHVGLLQSGVGRPTIVENIYSGPESMANRVTAYYREIFDRDPTFEETQAGKTLILNEDERALREWLLSSDEAYEAFDESANN